MSPINPPLEILNPLSFPCFRDKEKRSEKEHMFHLDKGKPENQQGIQNQLKTIMVTKTKHMFNYKETSIKPDYNFGQAPQDTY